MRLEIVTDDIGVLLKKHLRFSEVIKKWIENHPGYKPVMNITLGDPLHKLTVECKKE